jgi:hypothetical protein
MDDAKFDALIGELVSKLSYAASGYSPGVIFEAFGAFALCRRQNGHTARRAVGGCRRRGAGQ